MRVLFALPGLHRYNRGAEIAFTAIARELANQGELVTLIGSGQKRTTDPYSFIHASSVPREYFAQWPRVPGLRGPEAYEELTFAANFAGLYQPSMYDVTVTCSYPFTNWLLRRPCFKGQRPAHVFVTQNGDWPAYAKTAEFRFFGCEGLICTNPDFYERNKDRWRCHLIPNGVDYNYFRPGQPQRHEFKLPPDRLIVLMVSALIESKRVELGIDAVSRIPDAHLVVAGDGPLRELIITRAAKLLPGRFTQLSIDSDRMPALYQSADVFLHLSRDESFGNVFLEAMACGLPIVAHDSPRVRWIVGCDESLIDTNDSEAVTSSIGFARHPCSLLRSKRTRRIKEFSWNNVAAMYRDFLLEVINSRAKP